MQITSRIMTLALLTVSASALAIDPRDQLLCAVTQVNECLDGFGCEAVLPESVGAPTFIWVNISKKEVRTRRKPEGNAIYHVMELDGRYVLQGGEDGDSDQPDGAAWTLSIEDATGRFVGAVAAQQASITMFGACTELD